MSSRLNHSNEKDLFSLLVLLFTPTSLNIQFYEQMIDKFRIRGYDTPDKLLDIPLDDISKIIDKPVHVRKLNELIAGRSLKSFAIQVNDDGRGGDSEVLRQPTPRGIDRQNSSSSTSLLRRVSSIRASALNGAISDVAIGSMLCLVVLVSTSTPPPPLVYIASM